MPFNLLIPQPTPFPGPNAPPSKPEVSATPPPSPPTHASYVRNKSLSGTGRMHHHYGTMLIVSVCRSVLGMGTA